LKRNNTMDNKTRIEIRDQLFKQLEEDERELAYLVSEYCSIIDRYLFLQEEIESVRRQILSV
jgi:hypothetical protein